jgi:hypothetical protein
MMEMRAEITIGKRRCEESLKRIIFSPILLPKIRRRKWNWK